MSTKIARCLLGLAVVAGAALAAAPALAQDAAAAEARLAEDPDDLALLVAAGRACLAEASVEDGDALKRAERHLDRALAQAPDDPQILAVHGTMLTLKARDATLPLMKMRHVQNGLKEMDRAVELAPMDFGIRYQRGATCLHLPAIFERAGTAVADFEHLLAMAEGAPGSVPPGQVTGIRLNLAQARINNGEADAARLLLESVLAASPDSSAAARAKSLLDSIGG